MYVDVGTIYHNHEYSVGYWRSISLYIFVMIILAFVSLICNRQQNVGLPSHIYYSD